MTSKASGPLILTIPIPESVIAVAMAAIVCVVFMYLPFSFPQKNTKGADFPFFRKINPLFCFVYLFLDSVTTTLLYGSSPSLWVETYLSDCSAE